MKTKVDLEKHFSDLREYYYKHFQEALDRKDWEFVLFYMDGLMKVDRDFLKFEYDKKSFPC